MTDRAHQRADRLLVDRGLFESRTRARAAIEAGLVRADDRIVRKASEPVATDATLTATPVHHYVSRGGIKLAAALNHFGIDPKDKACLDVGASTGGFTQVLHERGARLVTAVDVGRAQLHQRLRGIETIVSLEQTDIRSLTPAQFAEAPDVITIDVSFISLTLVMPPVSLLAKPDARLIALIKPQFETGPKHVKKGIVRDPLVHQSVCDGICELARSLDWQILGVIPSPIEGGDGNREFLMGAARG